MGNGFNAVILSIGILLGIISPEADPVINARFGTRDGKVTASCELTDHVSASLSEVIASGTKVEFSVRLGLDGKPSAERVNSIERKQDGSYEIFQGERISRFEANRMDAAIILVSRFDDIETDRAAAQTAVTAELEAEIRISGKPVPVLWNYKRPAVFIPLDSIIAGSFAYGP